MNETDLQAQVNQLNQKMDIVLNIVTQQQLKTESVEDLLSDLQIVGKDMYDTAVVELENQQVEIDIDEIKKLGIRLLHNVENIGVVLSMFESMVDFAKDAGPLVRESIIDLTKRLHEFEQKGYFEFFAETGKVIDNVVSAFSKEDVAKLADNIVTILNTVKSLTQPEMMHAMDNALKAYNSMEIENIPEYSVFKLIREINKPEMKKAMGFMVTFMKNISAK
ncbi:DUF1641 domain-containing protein [Carboxylicivirga sp. A043]|uniref:DUF1641 domain-containing protein n=1 Tax=Carboxylicivirga litoralis TaxID=2816963 RepID=UPI0021CAF8D9|nr:hypothetical protein [Carboxylicivirga sp. A043]MCU4158130.1 DUF1641 domain-containing protein [Carboxylicivirga sp. A043]